MARLAFSTVACPDWTITRALDAAVDHGFEGVEFRSEGYAGAAFACEPGLTDGAKVRRMFDDRGLECAGLATGLRYDQVVFPPVLWHAITSEDRAVRDTKPFIDLAVACAAPTVRVFGFELPDRKRANRLARRRMIDRLKYAADAAHHTGVRLLLENGGSLPRAADVAEVLDAVDSRDLAACYALPAAAYAGESPDDGVRALGDRLIGARVKDLAAGRPCPVGEGELPVAPFVAAISRSPARWLVYEWDKAWLPELASADEALPRASRALYAMLNVNAEPVGARSISVEHLVVEPIDPSQIGEALVHDCRDAGFALAGVCRAEPTAHEAFFRRWLGEGRHGEMAWLAENVETRLDPRKLMPGASTIVMVGDLYAARGEGAGAENQREGFGKVARYARGEDYHEVIKRRLHALCDDWRERFPGAEFRACVDTAPFMEREHAARAGLGWIGKHTLLIHPRLGSYVLLGAVVTTLHAEPPEGQDTVTDHCGACTRCIDACPTHAIAPYSVDASRCISYLTIEKRGELPQDLTGHFRGWLFGCDICQEVCPHNSPRPMPQDDRPREEYGPRFVALNVDEVARWTPEDRTRAIKGSSMKRATLEMMKRNADVVRADGTP